MPAGHAFAQTEAKIRESRAPKARFSNGSVPADFLLFHAALAAAATFGALRLSLGWKEGGPFRRNGGAKLRKRTGPKAPGGGRSGRSRAGRRPARGGDRRHPDEGPSRRPGPQKGRDPAPRTGRERRG